MDSTPTFSDLSDQIRMTLDCADPTSPEYTAAVDNLKTIESMKPKKLHQKIDPNVVISAVGSLAGIAAILKFEKVGVIATKALGFIPKIRL